jgi:hypothetical protein
MSLETPDKRPKWLLGCSERREANVYSLAMTGAESRHLKVGNRVRWGDTLTDLGTVVGTAWTGVTIKWDDGHTTSIAHNDMGPVELMPVTLG